MVQIEETNLFPDKVTGTTKGCGFVTFKSQEQATNAMAALNGTLQLPVRCSNQIGRKHCSVPHFVIVSLYVRQFLRLVVRPLLAPSLQEGCKLSVSRVGHC